MIIYPGKLVVFRIIVCLFFVIGVAFMARDLVAMGPSQDLEEFREELKANPEKQRELFSSMARGLGQNRGPASETEELVAAVLGNPADLALKEQLKERLLRDAKEGFEVLKNSYEALSNEDNAAQKAALFDLITEFGLGSGLEARELALESLSKDVPVPSHDPEREMSEADLELFRANVDRVALAANAYGTYLQNAQGPEAALQETLRLLQLHPHGAVKDRMVEKFNKRFPELEEELARGVRENDIHVPFYEERLLRASAFRPRSSKDNIEEDLDR